MPCHGRSPAAPKLIATGQGDQCFSYKHPYLGCTFYWSVSKHFNAKINKVPQLFSVNKC